MKRDVLGLMLRGMHTYGDVVRFKLGPATIHLVCHPDDIAHVFDRPDGYDKRTFASARIRQITGDGLLVTNGQQWEAQRNVIQPALAAGKVGRFVSLIVRCTQRMLDQWELAARNGQSLDVSSEMMRLTYRVVEQALFSTDTGEEIGDVEEAITVAMSHVYARIQNPLMLPGQVPTPANIRFKRAMRTLESRVDEIIEQHRRGTGNHDLLMALLSTGSANGCPHLDDRSLRSQTITLLLAGHETTANALTWLWHRLDQAPDVADRVHREAATVLARGEVDKQRLSELRFTSTVWQEGLRLHPPIWAIVRRVLVDDVLGGYRIRRGTRLVISPYVTHRHPEFWSDAERFAPSRFEPAEAKRLPRFAYLPFGGGPRFCVGMNLARLEGLIVTAMVAQRYRLRTISDHRVDPEPGITLRCRGGLKMHIEPRSSSDAVS